MTIEQGLWDGHERQSSGSALNLSSNNPFRNRAVSPTSQSSASPFDDPPPPQRPICRNPFLDPALVSMKSLESKPSDMALENRSGSPTAQDIFNSLTLEDKAPAPATNQSQRRLLPPGDRRGPPPRRPGEMPPPGRRNFHSAHRPTRSQEEAMRARKAQQGGGSASKPSDSTRSPSRRIDRRPRRNSESSAISSDKTLTDEERKALDVHRRERERRHREKRDKKPTNRKLDIIDQLDATSIYGTGLFHHDGPFDALNPHRNRKNSSRAPMQAFPKDSLNNVLGGAGPLNARPDHATFMGNNDEEAFKEWSTGAKASIGQDGPARRTNPAVFDPMARASILHGDESMGLGTSTFLEGTPAARTDIQRREKERALELANESLQRKKSLAQRIRSINRGTRDPSGGGRLANPEGSYAHRRSPTCTSAGMRGLGETNSFFNEFESGKNDEESMTVRKPGKSELLVDASARVSPTNSQSLHGVALERRVTSDVAYGEQPVKKESSGLLARVKSLKGGSRRVKPVRGENSVDLSYAGSTGAGGVTAL